MARIGELLTSLLRQRTPESDPLSDGVLLERFARSSDQEEVAKLKKQLAKLEPQAE